MSKPLPWLHIELNTPEDGRDGLLLTPIAGTLAQIQNPATLYMAVGAYFQPDLQARRGHRGTFRQLRQVRDDEGTLHTIRRYSQLRPTTAEECFYDNLYVVLPDGTWWTFSRERHGFVPKPAKPILPVLNRTRAVLDHFFSTHAAA